MDSKTTLQRIKQNAELAENTIVNLKNELNNLTTELNNIRAHMLLEENAKLVIAVEEAQKRLVQVEGMNGVVQIPVPNRPPTTDIKAQQEIPKSDNEQNAKKECNEPKKGHSIPKKDKKEKVPTASEVPIDIGRLDLRVAKIEDVEKHPDADTLYVLKINCGEEKPRTVCSALVKFIPIQDLKNRLLVLLCNLKPVKMRGVVSEAMIMCASCPEAIEVLSPPTDAVPGDLVSCEGYPRRPDSIMNPKKKIFETVAPELHTNDDLEACYKNVAWEVVGKGRILAKSLKNCCVK